MTESCIKSEGEMVWKKLHSMGEIGNIHIWGYILMLMLKIIHWESIFIINTNLCNDKYNSHFLFVF